ncbi:MAG TPA: hypothetical protein PLB63_07400 [Planctomycetota bacterium]|nr:hypothetical protein [Planctomycetota bacterium]HQB00502.1 hypothetical protein [Planctomycetota bacterium]
MLWGGICSGEVTCSEEAMLLWGGKVALEKNYEQKQNTIYL